MTVAVEQQSVDETGDEKLGDEYLTFCLGKEDYGVDILRVQEIRGWEMVTRIPNSPGYVKGVLNLRGAIVPIFDLRMRLSLPEVEYNKQTVVIVLRVNGSSGERSVGVVVDAVSDVLNAHTENIRNTPEFGAEIATDFISGLAEANGKMIMLLDVDKLLTQENESVSDEMDAA